jgi:hypothetical protein
MRNLYFMGEMFLPDLHANPRYQNDLGSIVIGGDRGDVWATSAYNDNRDGVDGVVLIDVYFKTSLDLDSISSDELICEAEHVVKDCYDSVQEDTFAPSK